jgi:hypothetical protein
MKAIRILGAIFTLTGQDAPPILAEIAHTSRLLERADRLLANLRRAQEGRRVARIETARLHAHMQKNPRFPSVALGWYRARDASSVTRAKARRAQRAWDEFRAANPTIAQERRRQQKLAREKMHTEELRAEAIAAGSADAVSAEHLLDHKTTGGS